MDKRGIGLGFIFFLLLFGIFLIGCTQRKVTQQPSLPSFGDCIQKNNLWCYTVTYDRGSGEACGDTRDACLAMRAGEAKDVSLCGTISSQQEKDNCYKNVAGSMGDVALCNTITNSERKSQCIGKVAYTKGAELCANAPSSDDCYFEIVMSGPTSDKSLCDRIRDVEKKESCSFFMNAPPLP